MWDKNVREFFDARAALWDEKMVINEEVIRIILDKAGVEKGKDILDVACGTGVMIPFYLQRDVSSIDGIDISPEMVKIAGWIARVLREGEAAVPQVRAQVEEMMKNYPLYE